MNTARNSRKIRYFCPSMVPKGLDTDSYKLSHSQAMGPSRFTQAYIEARKPFEGGEDRRVVSYGVRYFLERHLMRPWTMADIDDAEDFLKDFNAGGTPHPFPRDLLTKFVQERGGWFPVRIQALRDGTVVHTRTPQLVITAEGEYAGLATWLETLALQQIWYMSTVATLSRFVVEKVTRFFDMTVDDEDRWKLHSRFHDFGFRGCTVHEQSIAGGSAHLLNSHGTDTCPGAWYATVWCNNGVQAAGSIPATEHSLMMSRRTEIETVKFVIGKFGHGVFATVADTYNYDKFLWEILPEVAGDVKARGGFHVVRPDSGDPVECVINGLRALEAAYGCRINRKGFKVILGAGIIQGDGINRHTVTRILEAVVAAGYSVENVAFGMGGGLLQKVDRDTLGYAMKTCYMVEPDGEGRPLIKWPKTDLAKGSMPGPFRVIDVNGIPTVDVLPEGADPESVVDTLLETVWDSGPVEGFEFELFDEMRERVNRGWATLPAVAENPWTEAYTAYRISKIPYEAA